MGRTVVSPITMAHLSCIHVTCRFKRHTQHTFGQKKSGVVYEDELGAVDWTCENFKENKDCLLELIIEHTNYLRLSVYETFIHCDYKNTHKNKRLLFESESNSKWNFIECIN